MVHSRGGSHGGLGGVGPLSKVVVLVTGERVVHCQRVRRGVVGIVTRYRVVYS